MKYSSTNGRDKFYLTRLGNMPENADKKASSLAVGVSVPVDITVHWYVCLFARWR